MICIVILGLGAPMGLGWAVEFLCGIYLIVSIALGCMKFLVRLLCHLFPVRW